MNNKELVVFINHALEQLKSKEDIYKTLLKKGNTIDEINLVFEHIYKNKGKEDSQGKMTRIMTVAAAILIGAGIFSFVASNWQEMSKIFKIVWIISAMIFSYSLGWYFKEKLNLIKFGESLILLGVIIYGAGIFLIAQAFNIRENWPDGFILWMLGSIAMGYAIDFYLLFYLAIIFGVISMIGASGFLLTPSPLLIIASIATFVAGWKIRNKILLELK